MPYQFSSPPTIEVVGDFARYEPSNLPDGLPANVMFCRRVGDGADWYSLIHGHDGSPAVLPEITGTVYATTATGGDGTSVLESVAAAPDRLFPQNSKVLAIEGYAGSDPQADLSGWIWDGTTLAPPPAIVSAPDLNRRQFAEGLWSEGIITFAEADAYSATAEIPPAFLPVLDTLADDDTGGVTPRKSATLLLRGNAFQFAHPLVDGFREIQAAKDPKWTAEYLRDRWISWAAL